MASGPRCSVMVRMPAIMISLTFSFMVSPRSSPCEPTGLAAPMTVSGAMAAT